MFNKQKLSTSKFVDAIRDTFVPSTSYINDISREDLELLLDDTQQMEMDIPDHEGNVRSHPDAEVGMSILVDTSTKDTEEIAPYEQQHFLNLRDDTAELVRKRTGFDEPEFRSQLTSLHVSSQSAFKLEVDSLYDLIDAHVGRVSQSLLVAQRKVMQEAEELIREIKERVLQAEELERGIEGFMEAVQVAYERAFPRLGTKD